MTCCSHSETGDDQNLNIKKKAIDMVRKQYHSYAENRAKAKAGFKAISQREAFLLEPYLTIEEKKHYCERKAYAQLGYFPNLDQPKTYSEKLIWLALHYKNPKITICADKAKLKDYVCEQTGEDLCVPAIGVYSNVNDIDFDALPDKFVAKSTSGWGSKQVIVVTDKHKLNWDRTKSQMAEWLYPWNNYYYNNLCITNENIKPRIIVEQHIGTDEPLSDYKVFCFNGKPRFMLVVKDRSGQTVKKTFYDLQTWEALPISRIGAEVAVESKPKNTDRMIEISEKLSKDFPLARIDFYMPDDKHLYVGEITSTPGMFMRINPREWDDKWGQYINIDYLMGKEEQER